ncbi:MAG: hypothetical protein JST82_11735 [Bacteroidetes bacterium]|nr:hypothetical protein [Bacteroidota bacterium]
MKKIITILSAGALLALGSCKDDFEVAAPYKPITVAYGVLNMADTAHYFRIEKAFLDESKSAIVMAQNPDSSRLINTDVFLRKCTDNGTILQNYVLTEVDLNKEGYPKQQGGSQGFYTTPSYAYKLKLAFGDTLSAYFKYRLVINNKNTGEKDSSEYVTIVNAASEKNPSNFYIPNFANSNYVIDFSATVFDAKFKLNGYRPRNGRMMEGMMRFHIVEKNAGTGARKDLYADYTYATDELTNPTFELTTLNSSFYAFLNNAFGAPPANTIRTIDSCDMYVYAGSQELYDYKLVTQAQVGGLLGDQIQPIFTNMKGNNVLGLIGSRASRFYKNVALSNSTIDSIKANPITKSLNISGRSED